MMSKGSASMEEYFTKMKGLADEMTAADKKLEDDEIVSYVLMGLSEEFDSVVTGVGNRTEPISLQELQAQLVSHEQRCELHDDRSHSINIATKGTRIGGGSYNNQHGGGHDGGHGGRGRDGGRGKRGRNFLQGVFS